MEQRAAIFGHSLPGQAPEHWEGLEEHLFRVALGWGASCEGSERFASGFGAGAWGRLAGLWHDIGKFSEHFQAYIRGASEPNARGPDHSTSGAVLAAEAICQNRRAAHPEGLMLSYVIAGHHAGLPDWADPGGGQAGLRERLRKEAPEIADAISRVPASIRDQSHPGMPAPLASLKPELSDRGLRVAMFVRMLFSCLVDADFLATEAFLDRERATRRSFGSLNTFRLLAALDRELVRLAEGAPVGGVAMQRADLLAACRSAAACKPGLFSLSAPTGSGKTLSSLAFALEHARNHGLRRVIYALPFTSVTEQTAETFRRVFRDLGDGVVLEHHSAASWRTDEENEAKTGRARLAAENWDAPVVVTTNVQVLESLFAARTSACRKLHRIAGSVVILDEAQALPVHLLRPTLTALDELARGYGVSVVLCSATMPALTHRPGFEIGLKGVREIVPDPGAMADAMQRVRVETPGVWSDQQLVDETVERRQVLVIVNTKRHAAEVFRVVRARTAAEPFHLSAGMCAEHRTDTLSRVRAALASGEECRVVSTQVIEAGVDIDFPVVFRAMAGIDSIAQAAGRCNREGRLETGEVVVFRTETRPSPVVGSQTRSAEEVAGLHEDLLSLESVEHYFRLHYWQQRGEWDRHGIAGANMFDHRTFAFQFRQAAERYRVIEERTTPVVVPYGERGRALVDELLEAREPDRALLRRTQRFTVSVYGHQLAALFDAGACEFVHDLIHVLIDDPRYDAKLGLVSDPSPTPPDRLIA